MSNGETESIHIPPTCLSHAKGLTLISEFVCSHVGAPFVRYQVTPDERTGLSSIHWLDLDL